MDSHSKTRTFAYTIMDAGDPASGLNINRTLNEGPTLHYSINNGTTTSVLLNPPAGVDIATCELNECDWSYTLTNLDRNDYVSYYATAVDKSTVASGTNSQTTSTNNFEVGDPNKMLIVEWRDIGYTSSTTCSFQAVFYDVTNEIEFKYDTGCKLTDDYSSTGFMDHTRTHGQHIRDASRYLSWTGSNPFTHNYRITTDGNASSVETFTQGMTEVQNAAEVISGTSIGQRMYYCASPYYWSRYTTQCNANIDLPGGFNFDYFEKSFDGDDADDRIRIGINGYMYFIDNGARSLEQGIYYWSSGNMPQLPVNSGTGQQYAREGTIAPYWSWGRMSYDQLYCYDTNTVDCGVYVRVLPFEGKGTEVETDLDCASSPSECIWDTEGSPYRINPSNDYLSISGGDLTIEPGTVIQVETGKGISFDGQCDSFKAEGEENNRIVFEGQNQGEWKGISFTDDCATTGGTDDRHVFSYVDFNNTSSAAISAGSRHSDYSQVCTDSNGGQRQCSSDKNVGNFTMTDVTFTNVETAIRHGSGAGTGFTMTDFTINGADKACINLPKSSDATIKEGTMTNCNTDGETWGGAVVTFPGSTGGMLHIENVTITNAYYNLISTDVQHVTVSNVTASVTSGAKQAGTVFTSNFGVDSEVNLFNFVADDYTSATINALKVINMTEVNWGQDTDLTIVPGGTGSTANGPFGTNAILDDVTVGDMMIYRMQPSIMNDVTSGHIDISGDAIVSDAVTVTNLDSGRFGVAGCGWTVLVTTIDADRVYSACTSSQSKNTMKFEDGTLTHTSNSDHAVYGRNSHISVGEIDITSSNAGNGVFLAFASQNTQIILIDVSQNGDDCADGSGSTGDCDTSSTAGSATIYYGGLAELRTYRLEVVGGSVAQVDKSGQTVTTSLVDSLNAELFEVGSHITGSNGKADVWVVTGDSSGNTYSNHNLRAFGSAGQNETMVTDPWYITDLSSGFTIGTSYALELKPAPKDFNGTNMDCAWLEAWRDADTNAPLPTNGTTSAGETIFEFDGTPITVSEDLTLDGCEIRLFGAEMKVKSTATNSPVISITNGGKLLVGENPTSPGALQAVSPSYPMTLLVQDGVLEVSGGVVRDLAQDTTTGAALYIGANAELVLNASGSIYGASTLSDDMATVKVEGGKITVDSGSIINTGVTGTALWIESSGGSLNNIAVSNAAVGIKAKDSAPQIDGFTSTGSDVGLDIDGGMTLPTIYRSTSLSGESRGWKTYPIDLSNFLGNGDYLQVGANSIYGGGNAHPRNQYSVNYYMISDRWNIEITYDDGSGEVSENVTSSDKLGYYPYGSTSSSGVHSTNDPASGNNGVADYAGGEGGVASWHCSYYGYTYGPAYTGTYDGYFRDIYQYWPEGPQTYVGWSFQGRMYPAELGFRWSEIDETYTPPSYSTYPYHYWSIYQSPYSWSSSGGWTGDFISPEGNVGHRSYYNVCADGAYKSRWGTPTPTGAGARMSFPIVDISSPTITAVTMYVDVLHNRADNFQDRFEFVARSGNDPSSLGDYKRESGVATFKNGVINGADTGIILGGSDAAATIESVTVNSPVFAGLDIDGSIGGSSIDDLEVNGGDYGMYVSSFARGQMDVTNFDFDAQDKAGIYYVTDMYGDHTGTITNSNGAAYKYGANTVEDIMFDSITLSGNSIGIETAGSGDITIKDSTFASVDEDIRITGPSEVDFVEGTIDSTSVVVTGTGGFDRQRALALTIDADSTAVEGATVLLMNGDGKVTGNAVTDASGIAQDLRFRTIRVDSSGLTTETLSGYEISTVAEVEYTTTVADFRYAFEAVTLQDTPGNAAAVSLTDNIDTRFCYTYTSAIDYNTLGPRCSGTHYLSTSGDRTKSNGNGGTITEYGYRGNDATFSNQVSNMNGKTIMVDSAFLYLEDGITHNWNNSIVFMTARYSWSASSALDTQRWYADGGNTNPSIYMHNTDVVGLNYNPESGNVVGLALGYYSDALDISIKDSNINPVASITSGMMPQYSWWWWSNSDYTSEFLRIDNTSMTHFKGQEKGTNAITSVLNWDLNACIKMYGTDGSYIVDSEFNNCPIGVYSARSTYYTGHSKSEYGADNFTIENNTFEEGGESYDLWIAGNAYTDNTLIKDNKFTSASSNAGVRVANSNTITNFGTKIIGNTFAGPQTPVYVADVGEYVVAGNDLTGTGDSTRIGIDIEGGYGDVSNNTLLDVDGGIVISDSIEAPGPTNVLCSIGETSYTSSATCTFTVQPGAVAYVDLDTDRYGYEISMVITKPDGSSDSWSSFWSNRFYSPLRTYTAPGTYTLTVSDRAADGGAEIEVYEQAQSSSYAGPTVENNSISLSANRIALNAIGISLKDCSKVEIYSKDNTIAIGDNAVSVDGCDLNDVDSVITGSNYLSSVGISSTTVGDSIVLDGTTVSGYGHGVEVELTSLTLQGDASISGSDAAVYADSATVTAIGASVDGGSTGTGLYMVDGGYSWIYPLDAAGDVGVYAENTEFRWDGGVSTATTALHAVESEGSVENLTWAASTTQINAGSNSYITSIGQVLDASKITIDPSATIDEANLFSLDATHLMGAASNVGMTIISTDGTRAAYVSPAFQPDVMTVDGDSSDWFGYTPLNPSDDAKPGNLSGDGTNDFYVTYTEGDTLYIAMSGEDLSANDLLIYMDVATGGSTTGYNLNGAHTLPMQADYLFWATSDTNMDLFSNSFLGWGSSSLSSDAITADLDGNFFEIAIPFSRIGGTPDEVNIVAIVQDSSANVQTVHPTQTVTTGVQTLSEYISVETTHNDLATGSISDEILVYHTYKGTTTPGTIKNYDVMLKTKADCEYDWHNIDDISMLTRQDLTADIERACPEIKVTLADDSVDEDSPAYVLDLNTLADDNQQDVTTLTWTVASGTVDAYNPDLVAMDKNGKTVTILPLADQFGTAEFEFVVTDKHGLTDTKNITITVNNINDKPVICNQPLFISDNDCTPVFVEDLGFTNIVPEGFGEISQFLGNTANATKSYIRDMDNENFPVPQVYTWGASVPSDCEAFSVSVTDNVLSITENKANEFGGTCTITLTLSDDGNENQDADSMDVEFKVSPVNDAPVILDWDVTTGAVITADNGSTPVAPWAITFMEDDLNPANLTYDLSAVKDDIDHSMSELQWTVEPTSQCAYENYFSITIVEDEIRFSLVPDATTTANAWEIDYLNDNGIHQIGPSGSDFCQISLVLKDTLNAPADKPNYDPTVMPIADYQQGEARQELGIRIMNVKELVADYYLDDVSGFDFQGINNVLTGTYVPVEVEIGAGGDQGPYTYDHMLAVTFHTSGGHGEAENVKYMAPPAWGETITVKEYVYIVDQPNGVTPYIWVEVDVLTCLDTRLVPVYNVDGTAIVSYQQNDCDLTRAPADRFQTDSPSSHVNYAGGVAGDQWSKPGAYGDDGLTESQRRPLLQDSNWCNNVMFSNASVIASDAGIPTTCNHVNKPAEDFLSSNDVLPSVVVLGGGVGSVPSFAPSLVVVALAGFFVTALAMASRREEEDEGEEEETRRIVEDEMAVSPVIATILMVAITVVLSGVIYVWASSLAETGKLGVPRVTFDIDNMDVGTVDGYWAITVDQTEAELATAAVTVTVLYSNSEGVRTSYATLLSNTSNVYGFDRPTVMRLSHLLTRSKTKVHSRNQPSESVTKSSSEPMLLMGQRLRMLPSVSRTNQDQEKDRSSRPTKTLSTTRSSEDWKRLTTVDGPVADATGPIFWRYANAFKR